MRYYNKIRSLSLYSCDFCGRTELFYTISLRGIDYCDECWAKGRRELEDSLINLHSRKRLWKILGGAEG